MSVWPPAGPGASSLPPSLGTWPVQPPEPRDPRAPAAGDSATWCGPFAPTTFLVPASWACATGPPQRADSRRHEGLTPSVSGRASPLRRPPRRSRQSTFIWVAQPDASARLRCVLRPEAGGDRPEQRSASWRLGSTRFRSDQQHSPRGFQNETQSAHEIVNGSDWGDIPPASRIPWARTYVQEVWATPSSRAGASVACTRDFMLQHLTIAHRRVLFAGRPSAGRHDSAAHLNTVIL
jgi:hypothetical protein